MGALQTHKSLGGGPGSCEEERENVSWVLQCRFVTLTCRHRKARRFCIVSTVMTVSKAVMVAMRNISTLLG
jgi:hypothetical protein